MKHQKTKSTQTQVDTTDTQELKSKSIQQSQQEENQNSSDYSSAPIEGTPFTMFRTPNGYVAVLGKDQITDYKKTEKEVLEELPNKKTLRTLITLMSAVASNVFDTREAQKGEK